MLGGNPRLLATAEADPEDEAFAAVLAERQAACEKERDEVLAVGGLLVIGTGEHASRRIDDQLRGRSGRQGDPGESMFALSLDDPVYERAGRRGAVERLRAHTESHPEAEPIEDGEVLSSLRSLRDAVEVQNQAARRDVFKIDTVVHERREAIWSWRRDLLETTDLEVWKASAAELLEDLAERLDERARAATQGPDRVPPKGAWDALLSPIIGWGHEQEQDHQTVVDGFGAATLLVEDHGARYGTVADEPLARWERAVLLAVIDSLWPDYLDALERTEDEVWMRTYAQVDPFVEFRREAAVMFGELMVEILSTAARAWLGAEIQIIESEPSEA
jgi:preprotein translocase subunit SecA